MEANMVTKNEEQPQAAVSTTPTRDSLRAEIFKTRERRTEIFEFFGVQIELRQPTYGDVAKARSNEDREGGIIDTLVDQAFVPGTDIRIFTQEDADSFKAMPFGKDFLRVAKALENLTEVDFRDSKKPATE
jgi:hypothetical protein